MGGAVLQAEKREYLLTFDPRTKILLVITIGIVLVGAGNNLFMETVKLALIIVPFLLLLVIRRTGMAIAYVILYVAGTLLGIYLLPLVSGVIKFLLTAFCMASGRFLPSIMMAYFLVSTTTVSEFVAAMERIHLPQKLVIPMSVVFRFFPTVAEEFAAINDAMRMRGIRFGGGKPLAMLEYYLVPLIMCSVKIGEELSAAALTRGLGAPNKRTNVCQIGLRAQDVVTICLCVVALSSLLLQRVDIF